MLHHMLPPSYCIGKTVNGSTDETEQKPYDNKTCPARIFLIDTIILCPTEDCNPVCYSLLTEDFMNMHDKMAKELFDNKSLKALSYLIEHGRELEFEYDKKICFLSKDNSSGFVSIWVEKKEQYFDSMEQLIEKAEINKVSFEEIWEESELNILY